MRTPCFSFMIMLGWILGAGFLLSAPVSAAEAGGVHISDIRLGGGEWVPGHGWVEGRVTVSLTSTGTSGTRDLILDVTLRDNANRGVASVRVPVSVAGGGGQWRVPFLLPVPGGHAGSVQAVQVEVLEGGRRRVASAGRRLTRFDAASSAHVVYIGSRLGAYFLPPGAGFRVPGAELHTRSIRASGTPMLPDDLPHHVAGYGGVSSLVWHDPDMGSLVPEQRTALADFVRQGGHLVLLPPNHGQTRMERSFPGVPGVWSTSAEAVSFVGDAGLERMPGLFKAAEGRVTLARANLAGVPVRGVGEVSGRVLLEVGERPILVRGQYGAGTVTVSAVDVSSPPLQDTAEGVAILSRALELPLRPEQLAALHGASPKDNAESSQRYYHRIAPEPTSRINEKFRDAFETTPLHPFWVFLFTTLYAVCAGPCLYVVLRRKGKLGWTALYLAGCGLFFTVLMYMIAFVVKGSATETLTFAILDVSADGKAVHRGIGTLYTVRPGYVRLDAGDGVALGALESTDLRQQWGRFHSMDMGLSLAAGNAYLPHREGVAPESVRVHQWSLSSYSLHESVEGVEAFPAVSVSVKAPEGEGRRQWVPKAEIRTLGGERIRFPAFLLVTEEGVFPHPGGSEPESVITLEGMSLVAAMAVASGHSTSIRQNVRDALSGMVWRGMMDWQMVLQVTFPRLTGEQLFLHSWQSGRDEPPLQDFIKHISPENPAPGPVLTPWQILTTNTEAEDLFQLDLTRVLCEGGGVVLRVRPRPFGTVSVEGLPTERRGETLFRDVIAPERIER